MSDLNTTHWRVEHSENVATLWLDKQDSQANSLSAEVLEQLEQQLIELENPAPQAIVIRSAKASGFIAGADIEEFTTIETEAQARELISRAHDIINRLEALPCVTIAVIHGFCLGGGLELALACDYRIAVNDPRTRLGLPEVKLGIHPGFGGTARMIERVGVLEGMQLMLTGKSLGAYQAKKSGLVDALVAPRVLDNAIDQYSKKRKRKSELPLKQKLLRTRLARTVLARIFSNKTEPKAPEKHYPAPHALIDLFKDHGGSKQEMLEAEIESEARLIVSNTSRNLVRVFQLSELLKAKGKNDSAPIERVHVIGAGTMGGDIALWCALQGLKVTVEDFSLEAIGATIKRAEKLYARRFRGFPQLEIAARDRLVADPSGRGRKSADLVIEAIVENAEIKRKVFAELESITPNGAILATNTSSIPLQEIAQAMDDPSRLVGIHFFNPATKMPLVEVVRSESTDPDVVARASAFCVQIDKLPLEVTSSPGFLVNRVLMPYMLEAATMAEEGIAYETIDKAATQYGMPMGPIELADTVGLDICLHVAEVLAGPMNLHVPESIRQKVEQGKLGVKSGEGFYRYKDGKPEKKSGTPAPTSDMQKRLIGKIMIEAQRCLSEGVVGSEDEVDAGVIFGTGFAPFRGGPLHDNKYGDAMISADN